MKLRRHLVAFLVLFFTGAYFAAAQTGTLAGVVSDSTGAVVSDASVTAQNDATNATRNTMTGAGGSYSISSLPPGIYTVTVSKAGFTNATFNGVGVSVAQTLPLDAKLNVGSATTVVNVAGSTEAPVEVDSSQLSTIVDGRTIEMLPLITRDPYSLVLLSPGTVQATSSLGGFSVNGARERNNNFLLDGVDNNDTSVPGIASGISSSNPEAVSEYRVITNNFEAQYGRNTGAIINVVTMSGSNKFHGDGYWFGRYNALGARDWFNRKVNQDGTVNKQNPYVRNIFGASLGGPIWRDRTFFFFNADLQRYRTTTTATTLVPTAAFKSGVFTYQGATIDLTNSNSPGNINHYTIDPRIAAALALFPSPNAGTVDDIRGNYQFGASSRQDQNAYTVRGDHKIIDGHILTLRYVYNKLTDPNPGYSDLIPGLGSYSTAQLAHNGMLQLNSVFGTNITNLLAVAYNQTDSGFFCNGVSTFDKITGVDSLGNGQDFTFPGLFTFGCSQLGDSNGQERLTGTRMVVDGFTFVKGAHTARIGGEYRAVREDGYDGFNSRTTDTFNVYTNGGNGGLPAFDTSATPSLDPNSAAYTTLQDLVYTLAGVVQQQSNSQNFDKAGVRTRLDYRRYRQHEFAFYGQDNWKVLPRLSLNLGLRYEYYGVPYEIDNNLSQLFTPANFSPTSPNDVATFQIVGPGTGHQLYKSSPRLFQPRAGFAYDLLANGKIAIRGGAGSFNDRIFGNLFGNSRTNPPFQQQQTNLVSGQATLATVGFPTQATPSASLPQFSFSGPALIDPNLKQQASYNWNFGIQAELAPNLVLETNYVGAHGLHILRVVDGNAPDPAITAQLVAFCMDPANFGDPSKPCGTFGEDATHSAIKGTLSWFGNTLGTLPFDAAHNTVFFEPGINAGIASSSYNALEAVLTKRFSGGFNVRAAYTWAHSLDDAGDPLAPGGGQRSFPRNSNRLDLERGNSDFDVKNRIVIDGTYELPVGFGRAHLSHGFVGKTFQGLTISGLGSAQSGQPIDLFGNRDSQHQGLSGRLTQIGPAYPHGLGSAIIPDGSGKRTGPSISGFELAPYDSIPSVGRNKYRGPNYTNIDAVFQKDTSFEAFHVLLRVESYNILNHPQFSLPGNAFADPGTFGISTSTNARPDGTTSARQIQAALKLAF